MAELLLTGIVVVIAVLIGGFLLQHLRGPARDSGDASRLRDDKASLEKELAAAKAYLEGARKDVEEAKAEAHKHAEKLIAVTAERDALDRRLVEGNADTKALGERLKDLREAKEQMRQEFNEIAGKLMESHGNKFKEQNKEQIDKLLTPLKTKIEEFEKGVTNSHSESVKQHAALKEQIKMLSDQSAKMSQETQNLTSALKGKVQTQGAWGEMILETILQRSGLREGEEYTVQDSHTDDEGRRLRTDVIVNLPNGERIIVDAKVSLKDFENFVNANDDRERDLRLAQHAASVKNHIKILAGKEYHSAVGSKLDFVIMFVPIEAALGAALQHDGDIGFFAADNKVAIATPTTLTIALKTVAAIWRVERQNQNAAEIAKRAGKLYDKFVGFLGDMSDIGERLKQAERAYAGAMGKLKDGRGNLVGQVEKLKSMGAETNKAIPDKFLEEDAPLLRLASGSEDDDDDLDEEDVA